MKRLLATGLALSAWVAGTLAGSLGTAPPAGASLLQVGRAHEEAAFAPSLDGDDPIFVLVIGSDARPGTPTDAGLADSLHILGINPAAKRATLFGIPRDAYVPISTGGTNKINTAMPGGGPQAQIDTIEQLTGITFDYYALTGFGGFSRAVDDIGGLTIDVPFTVDGPDGVFEAGVATYEGREALSYARTRKTLPRGDFDRSLHQGIVMISALTQFREEYGADAGALLTWLGAGLREVELDVPLDELTRLSELAMDIKPSRVTNLVALGSSGMVGSMSVVNLSSDNERLFQDIEDDGFIMPKAIPEAAQVQA
jgi:LCP family protein required for cell wall assembly